MNNYGFTRAPWTDGQVDALNRFQRRVDVHPFTCPMHSEMRDVDRSLFATTKGWICAHCDYTQDWAHQAMLSAPDDPADTAKLAAIKLKVPHAKTSITANDYFYEGTLVGIAVKKSGVIRYVVEDDRGRLFIHNAAQLGKEEGWMP